MTGTSRSLLALLVAAASLAGIGAKAVDAAPLLIVGIDEKVSWDAKGDTVLAPPG
jgi:hypothetical protein